VAVAEFLADCRYRDLAPATLRAYRWGLARLAREAPRLPADPKQVRSVLSDQALALESRHDLRRILQRFFNWTAKEYGHPNPLEHLEPLRRHRNLPRVLTPDELQNLWLSAEPGRDQTLLAIALDGGLRVGEIATLRRYNLGQTSAHVDGKTGQRVVPLSRPVLKLLAEVGRGDHLWLGRRGPLTTEGLKQAYRRMFADAGITGRKTGPHTLRHTFGTMYVRSGGNLRVLQEIMGHKNLETTMLYVHLAGRDVAADHARHSPVHTLLKEIAA
jgi:site-specific recombinase XerD